VVVGGGGGGRRRRRRRRRRRCRRRRRHRCHPLLLVSLLNVAPSIVRESSEAAVRDFDSAS